MNIEESNEIFESLLFNEIINIGDNLIDKSEIENGGLCWKTISLDEKLGNEISWKKDTDLYRGVSGISLFLIELFNYTQQEKYLIAAEKSIYWVLNTMNLRDIISYSLYTGKMGIAVTLSRFYEITRKELYLDNAIAIAKESIEFIEFDLYELINGVGGTLLGLLKIHEISHDDDLLIIIDKYIEKILNNIKVSKKGIYWDILPNYIRSLCGYSHGASGLAYVFTELGSYFKKQEYIKLAELIIEYENQFFNFNATNWLDLRNSVYEQDNKESYEDAYLNGDKEFFIKTNEMNAWCHGAAGIGLSRLRISERLNDFDKYEKDILASIEKTINTDVNNSYSRSSTLCHGSGGNAELFLEAYNILKDKKFLELASVVAKKILLEKKGKGYYISGTPYDIEDNSLFVGNAGIGLFLLRLLTKTKVPSILSIKIEGFYESNDVNQYKFLIDNLITINKSIINSSFRRTLYIVEVLISEKLNIFLQKTDIENCIDSWIIFVKETLLELPSHESNPLEEILNLELLINEINNDKESANLLAYKKKRITNNVVELLILNANQFNSQYLVTNSDILLIKLNWSWKMGDNKIWLKNLNLLSDERYCLLDPIYNGIIEHYISEFSYLILQFFEESKSVGEAVELMYNMFSEDNETSFLELKKMIIAQIKEMVQVGWLLDLGQHPLNVRTQKLIIENTF